jgi:phosphoribosylformylglycinamidine cyclo-ligase
VLAALAEVRIKGLAHITGGGLVENVPRVLPGNVCAELRKSAWPRPPLFDWLQENGNVSEAEMHRVFNCGIGMVAILAADQSAGAMRALQRQGETVFRIGEIRSRRSGEAQTIIV